ncbi:MAG: hypothetical protein KAV87_11490, partial [Desulfobacteraceae bacterium]|nr:hypothetical protein [Desulfobacteraceae bacterium]
MKNCGDNHRTLRIEPGLAGLTEEQLEVARSEAAKQKISLCESILKLGLVSETELLTVAAEKIGLKFLNISDDDVDSNALKTITANVASHYNIVPLRIVDNTLWIATCDPFNQDLKNEIELVLDNSHKIEFVLATSESIKKVVRKSYGVGAATVEQMVTGKEIDDSTAHKKDLMDESKAREASVIKLVNQLLADAISAGA